MLRGAARLNGVCVPSGYETSLQALDKIAGAFGLPRICADHGALPLLHRLASLLDASVEQRPIASCTPLIVGCCEKLDAMETPAKAYVPAALKHAPAQKA